jgi:glycosyltransferase involved in cell wall biosynthesis
MSRKRASIAVAWSGLPPYAAYCLRSLVETYPGRVTVLGTQADVPHAGIEAMVGQNVIWLERNQSYSWADLGLEVPSHFIHTGWAYPAFNALGAEVQAQRGRRYSMIDSIWYGRLKQCVGLLYFRAVYRKWFDAVMVPGRTGRRFCRMLGMPDAGIFEGMYGSNPEIFTSGSPLEVRPKRILFVGRLIERKGILPLLQAARKSAARGDGWEFVIIGAGPLEERLRAEPAIRVEPFAGPDTIAEWMRSSRFLVLPSVEENWGVVVHEAALSGCGLILSEGIGAAADLLQPGKNGLRVKRGDAESLSHSFKTLSKWDTKQLEACEETSLELAADFGPKRFVENVMKMTACSNFSD